MQVAQIPSKDRISFNFFKINGANTYGTLGIGLDDNMTSPQIADQVYQLREFANKKVYSMAMGDFHTIAIASTPNCDGLPGQNQEIKEFKQKPMGAEDIQSDVYAWGFNLHG